MDAVSDRPGDDYHRLKKTLLENAVYTSSEASKEAKRVEQQSQCFRLRVHMIDAAISEAKGRGLDWEDGKDLVSQAAEVAGDLAFSRMDGAGVDGRWRDPALTVQQAREIFRITYAATPQTDLVEQARTKVD